RSCCPSPVLLPPLPPPSATLFPYTTLFRSIEGGLVTQDATSAAQRRAPERAAGASHRGDQRPPGQDQEAPGRRLRVLGEGLHHQIGKHTSELQSPYDLVCRLLLEKKKKKKN